jgi:hypothetical protein
VGGGWGWGGGGERYLLPFALDALGISDKGCQFLGPLSNIEAPILAWICRNEVRSLEKECPDC